MVSLATLVNWKGDKPLGGVVGLSGLQGIEEPADINLDVIRQTPLFLYHGTKDQVLKFENSEKSFEYIKDTIYSGDHSKNFYYKTEKMAHEVSPNEINMMTMWLTSKFKAIDDRGKPVGKEEEKKEEAKV